MERILIRAKILWGMKWLNILEKIDKRALEYISEKCKTKTLDKVMPIITMMGNLGIIWFIISTLLILKVEYRVVGIGVILALALTTIIAKSTSPGISNTEVYACKPSIIPPLGFTG